MRPAPTDEQLARLKGIETSRNRAVLVVVLLVPLLLLASRFAVNSVAQMTLAVSALVIGFAMLIRVSFLLRCPRCKGWITIPKCPACGLRLDKPARSGREEA